MKRLVGDRYSVRFGMVGMIYAFHVESRRRDLAPGTLTLGTEIPQLARVCDIASESTAHANDGNGRVVVHDDRRHVEVLG